jgi:tripartite-type tricarboxylate transporter receptor subunit TctC
MKRRSFLLGLTLLTGFFGSATIGAQAEDPAEFYKGKTLTWVVSTGPGGGHDFYARLIARHMQKFLPETNIIIRNVGGAGHIMGANMVYASKPDGLTIGSFSTGLVYGQIVDMQGIQFDLGKMSWIGKGASDSRVMLVAKKAPFKTFDDLRKATDDQPILFVTSGVGSGSYIEAHMVARAYGLKAKFLTGYSGNEGQMSLMRGETHATMDGSETTQAMVDQGIGFLMVQFGKEVPNVPDGREFATNEEAKTIVSLLEAQSVLARITAGPPGIPADRLEYLRDAYRKTLTSPELLADAAKAKRTIKPAYGEAVGDSIRRALKQPPDVVALLKSLVTKID